MITGSAQVENEEQKLSSSKKHKKNALLGFLGLAAASISGILFSRSKKPMLLFDQDVLDPREGEKYDRESIKTLSGLLVECSLHKRSDGIEVYLLLVSSTTPRFLESDAWEIKRLGDYTRYKKLLPLDDVPLYKSLREAIFGKKGSMFIEIEKGVSIKMRTTRYGTQSLNKEFSFPVQQKEVLIVEDARNK